MLLEADVPIETVSVADSSVEPFGRARSSALETPLPPSAESFHRDLVLSMRNGVVAIHRDGSVAVVNECAYRTLGLTPDSRHLGQHYSALLGADHQFAQVFGTAFELAHLPNRCEVRLGETGKVLGYTLSRIVDAENRVTGAVLYFKDLTRVEQLEERERLRDRLAALGEMAAAIAHEVKNPLTGIQVMAGLLKRQSSMSDDDQTILHDIISEARVANKIVVDLLEFVRPISLQIERVSVADVLRDTVLKYERPVAHQNVVLAMDVDDNLPTVRGDHTQLRQLFTNLLVNAFEALDGRGRLTIAAGFVPVKEAEALTDEPGEASGAIVIDIEDDGPGIPEDVRERIFSPFFTTKPRGSGLGLAIVRKIVDAHDGRIDVTPRIQGGTHFQVTVPVLHESTAAGPTRPQTQASCLDAHDARCGELHIAR